MHHFDAQARVIAPISKKAAIPLSIKSNHTSLNPKPEASIVIIV
jgi:hypothetical protein